MMRAAVYYAPQPDDPLWRTGCSWLGRDPERGENVPQAAIEDLPALTAAPRRYGFHATLKPPMRISGDLAGFEDALAALARRFACFALPPLAVTDVGGFLALTLAAPSPSLHALADACVMELDGWRLPPDDAELARRRGARLSDREDALLARWGYPYVLDCWQFHMTLTRRLNREEMARVKPLAEAHFAASLARERRVEDLSLFVEPAAGADFRLTARRTLRA